MERPRFAGPLPAERVVSIQVFIEEALIMVGRKLAAVIRSVARCSFRGGLTIAPEQEARPKDDESR